MNEEEEIREKALGLMELLMRLNLECNEMVLARGNYRKSYYDKSSRKHLIGLLIDTLGDLVINITEDTEDATDRMEIICNTLHHKVGEK